MKKLVAIVCAILFVCCYLTGCEYWKDENDTSHFMLFGERGVTKDGKPLTEEDSSFQMSSTEDNLSQSLDNSQKDTIKGDNLKRGWTSDDNSILKGRNVSVTSETELFVITAKEDRAVIFNFKVELGGGEYELVLISPDKSETGLMNWF